MIVTMRSIAAFCLAGISLWAAVGEILSRRMMLHEGASSISVLSKKQATSNFSSSYDLDSNNTTIKTLSKHLLEKSAIQNKTQSIEGSKGPEISQMDSNNTTQVISTPLSEDNGASQTETQSINDSKGPGTNRMDRNNTTEVLSKDLLENIEKQSEIRSTEDSKDQGTSQMDSNNTTIVISTHSSEDNGESQSETKSIDDAIDPGTTRIDNMNTTKVFAADSSKDGDSQTDDDLKTSGGTSQDNLADNATLSTSDWSLVAPAVETQIPQFFLDYVDFHRKSLETLNPANDTNHYLIYTCNKSRNRGSCSGTGNRQNAIHSLFLTAMLTKRVFLIDIDSPVNLSEILSPNLLDWTALPSYIDKLPSEFYNLKRGGRLKDDNRTYPDNKVPYTFSKEVQPQVVRILDNGPPHITYVWRSKEMQSFLKNGIGQPRLPHHLANKWIFSTLFRPSHRLIASIQKYRTLLKLTSFQEAYVGIHVRAGGDFGGSDEARYRIDNLKPFLDRALQFEGNQPIVIASETPQAKEVLKQMNPRRVRTVENVTVIHVDKLESDKDPLEGSLGVWTDILVLAQSSCLVMSRGTFSRLAKIISQPETGIRCIDDSLIGVAGLNTSTTPPIAVGKQRWLSRVSSSQIVEGRTLV